jgi:hypothetical protein
VDLRPAVLAIKFAFTLLTFLQGRIHSIAMATYEVHFRHFGHFIYSELGRAKN